MKGPVHVLAVLGEGGHSKECLRLIELMGTDNYRYSYVLVNEDNVTESKLRSPGPVYRVPRPRWKTHPFVVDAPRYLLCALQSAIALLRARPEVIITTGPSVALVVCALAKVARARVVFVETGSRIHNLSPPGRIMRHLADLYFVQWEELLPVAPGALYAGRLI